MIQIAEGETYIVSWNGVDYKCIAFVADDVVSLGNASAFGGEDTGEPFVIVPVVNVEDASAAYTVIMPLDGSTTLTISIRQEVTEIQKISGKYVEGMGYSENAVVLAECQTTGVLTGTPYLKIPADVLLTVGEKYIVNLNGAEYSATAYDSSITEELAQVGTAVLLNDEANLNTGENIAFIIVGGEEGNFDELGYGGLAAPADGSTTLTISIRQETIHPIDPKFLPSGVGGGQFVVTFTADAEYNITADKTWQEVYDAYFVDGKQISGVLVNGTDDHALATLVAVNGDDVFFVVPVVGDEALMFYGLRLSNSRADVAMTAYSVAPLT